VTSLSARHRQTENGNTQLADGLRADSGSHLQRTLGPQHQRASDSRGPAWPDRHIQSSPDRTQTWVVGMRKVSSESLVSVDESRTQGLDRLETTEESTMAGVEGAPVS